MPWHYIIRNVCCRRFGFVTSRKASGFIAYGRILPKIWIVAFHISLYPPTMAPSSSNHAFEFGRHFRASWQFKLFDNWKWCEIEMFRLAAKNVRNKIIFQRMPKVESLSLCCLMLEKFSESIKLLPDYVFVVFRLADIHLKHVKPTCTCVYCMHCAHDVLYEYSI